MRRADIETLPVGHHARPAAALVLRVAAAAAAFFTVFAVLTTQLHAARAGSPWQDDPYDTVVSFTQFFVPALAVLAVSRAWLCRQDEPLPLYRIEQLLRTSLVYTMLIAATIAVDWVAVAVQADHALWNDDTSWLITALAILTGMVLSGFSLQWLAIHRLPRRDGQPDGDWLDDATAVLDALAARHPWVDWLTARLRRSDAVGFLRGHFGLFSAVFSIAAGLLVAIALAREDGFNPLLFFIEGVVFAGGTFAFGMICNTVLHIADAQSTGRMRRSARIAVTAGSLALPISLALRDSIWSAIGRDGQVDSVGQLAGVTLVSALATGALAFGSSLILIELASDARSDT